MGNIETSALDTETGVRVNLHLGGRYFVGVDGAFLGEYFRLPEGYDWPNGIAPFPEPPADAIEVPGAPGGVDGWVWDFQRKNWIAPEPTDPPAPLPPSDAERITRLEAKVAALEGDLRAASPRGASPTPTGSPSR